MINQFYELDRLKITDKMYQALDQGEKVSLYNVKGGLTGFIAMMVFRNTQQSVLFLTPTDREARQKYDLLSKFEDLNVCYFPLEHVHSYFSDAHSLSTNALRLSTLDQILSGEKSLVIASFDSLLKKLVPTEVFETQHLKLTVGEEIGLDHCIKTLSAFGYERSYQVEGPGQFSVRGDILDIYALSPKEAYRIEFFDDEIDSIRYLDAKDQRSQGNLDSIVLSAASEAVLDDENRSQALKKIEEKYPVLPPYLDQVHEEPASYDELFLGFIKSPCSLLDYLQVHSPEMTVVWDEPVASRENAMAFLERAVEDFIAFSKEDQAIKEESQKFFSVSQIETRLKKQRLIYEYLFHARTRTGFILDMDSRAIESFAGQPAIFELFLKNRIKDHYYIHFFCKDEAGLDKVKKYLNELDIHDFAPEDSSEPGIRFSIGEISEGFELAKEHIVFLNESDFFRPEKKKRRKKNPNAKKIDRFTDLKVGDYVVHDVHGIGVYRGIEQMEISGVTKDLMHIEYAGDASLYIPVEQMDTIQVYIGTGEAAPKVSKMGSAEWVNAKNKARHAVEDMADELIKLYAKRRELKGYAFSKDTPWQQAFEDAFVYDETDDQLRSVEEIKQDMESDLPMDRLLCGDVGYGKTEVAFRAAFKAAMEGKQTAFLVPTTVLAQQHFHSALERFKGFDVKIEVLSRFKTPQEQKKIIQDLQSGKIDILIGTHRMLSKDIRFKDLGLLIIDEEQRFGVRSKEKIKQLKENIDVLTLSATPIPRTLHMSLSGVRDMSVLEEPPHGRLPVQTYVMNYSPAIIGDAIEREISRGGQIYYIHNRVQDIDETTAALQRLVPEARIISAHGKMSGKELESIMEAFLNKEYDILVATTIVESGLDVKNANTLIVDQGDQFGLAQLYQLRGRVGRSDQQAYAYITHRKQLLSEVAEKRLKAIRDFTAFGSGFKIALRDLEIRGAGNLLGAEQSGHLAKIGYELYTRILEETVRQKMTGIAPEPKQPVRIQLPINAFIPKRYISQEETKYDIYSQMAYLSDWKDYDQLEEEMLDRFGEIPQSVYNLMVTAMIKNAAERIGVTEISERDGLIRLSFASPEEMPIPPQEWIAKIPKKWRLKFNAGKPDLPVWSFKPDQSGYALLKVLYAFLLDIEKIKKAGEKREVPEEKH